jgi:hypothetical protein
MESYKEPGLFWRPTDPEDRVVGELTFNVRKGVALTLYRPSDDAWPKNPALIVGVAGTQEVTLLDSSETGRSTILTGHSLNTQVFHADQLLIGHAFDQQEHLKFTSVSISYHDLVEWVNSICRDGGYG